MIAMTTTSMTDIILLVWHDNVPTTYFFVMLYPLQYS